VIPGWVEALPLMRFGDNGQLSPRPFWLYGAQIPTTPVRDSAHSVLIFEVELLDIRELSERRRWLVCFDFASKLPASAPNVKFFHKLFLHAGRRMIKPFAPRRLETASGGF